MKVPLLLTLLVVACAGCASQKTAGTGAAKASSDGILSRERIAPVMLSPDGKLIAAVVHANDESRVVFYSAADLKPTGNFKMTGNLVFDRFAWATDQRIVAEIAEVDHALAPPMRTGEILAVDVDGSHEKWIFSARFGDLTFGYGPGVADKLAASGVKARQGSANGSVPEDYFGSILQLGVERGESILVAGTDAPGEARKDAERDTAIYKVDIKSGGKVPVARGPAHSTQFFLDDTGTVRWAWVTRIDGTRELQVLDTTWKVADGLPPISETARVAGYSAAKKLVYVIDRDADGYALFGFNLEAREKKMLLREPNAMPRDVVLDSQTGELVAVSFDAQEPKWKILNGAHPSVLILKAIFAAISGKYVRIVSSSDDQKSAIVHAHNAQDPGAYYLVNAGDGSVRMLFPNATAQGESQVESLEHVLVAHPAKPASENAPAVLLVDGTGHAWELDREAQYFASRGFKTVRPRAGIFSLKEVRAAAGEKTRLCIVASGPAATTALAKIAPTEPFACAVLIGKVEGKLGDTPVLEVDADLDTSEIYQRASDFVAQAMKRAAAQ